MSDQKDRDKATQPLSSSSSSSSLGNQRAPNDVWNNPQLLRLNGEIDSVTADIKAEKGKLEDFQTKLLKEEDESKAALLTGFIDELKQSIADLKAKENKLLEQRDRLTQSLSGNTAQAQAQDVTKKLEALSLHVQQIDSKLDETRYQSAKGSTSFAEEWKNHTKDAKEVKLSTFFSLFGLGSVQKSSTSDAFSEQFEDRQGVGQHEAMVALIDDPLECAFQHYVMSQLALLQKLPIYVRDTSSNNYLDGRKPDVSGLYHDIASPLYVIFAGEVKRKGDFSPSALGELLTFLKRVLCSQPTRRHIIGFLLDGFEVVFVGLLDGKVKFTPRLSLASDGIGRLALISFMQLEALSLGWSELKMPEGCVPKRFVGSGATSLIYTVSFSNDEDAEAAIVKYCKDEGDAKHEANILTTLSESTCPNVPDLVRRQENMLVLTPLAQRFIRNGNMPTAFHFKQLLGVLRHVHDQKLVHCDLRPENWMHSQDDSVLIDWGFARPQDQLTAYRGTVSFASQSVLETLLESEELIVEVEDDLESFVRLAFYFITGRRPIYEECMTGHAKAEVSRLFWVNIVESYPEWASWVGYARARNYDELERLAQYFG